MEVLLMTVKQISVFVENKTGNFSDVVSLLGENAIDIRALSLADTSDFGIARMLVSDTDKAVEILKEQGYAVKCTDVSELLMDHVPGGLSKILKELKKQEVGIEYLYAFADKEDGTAKVVMRTSEPDKVEELFK